MNYKILVDSKSLYEFADEKTRLSVFEALILSGKTTNYQFEESLNIQGQKNIADSNLESERKPVQFMTVGGKFFISQTIRNIFENHRSLSSTPTTTCASIKAKRRMVSFVSCVTQIL